MRIFCFPHIYKIKNRFYKSNFNISSIRYLGYEVLFTCHHYFEDKSNVKIGDSILLSDGVRIDYSGGVVIGDNVTISMNTIILSHKHPMRVINRNDHTAVPARVEISDGAWIGAGAIIMPGVKIGENATVLPGCVVSENVEAYSIVQGNPGVIIASVKGITGEDE